MVSRRARSSRRIDYLAMSRILSSVVLLLCCFGHVCETARILAIFPTPSISHQIVFRKLTLELSRRGHELVIFTPDPVKDSRLRNYTEVDLHFTYDFMCNFVETSGDFMAMWYGFVEVGERVVDGIFSSVEMQKIIAPGSKERFDLIIVEYLAFDAIYALMSRLDAPMIGISSLPLTASSHYSIGNPLAHAYTPGVFDAATDDLDFWGRLSVAYESLRMLYIHTVYVHTKHNKLVKKYFGSDMPHVSDFGKDMHLILVNEHTALGYPRPNLPNIIQIGGIALDRTLKGLDPELKNFLDGAVNGFVYFSLGSNVKSKQLPAWKLNELKAAFAELPYKVLWKWELDTLPGKPDNVYISKWLPQCDVLAHPNIKVFVYQGGLQSTEEAISWGVPLVGIPVFADQEFNVRKIVSIHLGKRLDFEALDKDVIKDAINDVASDKGYKERTLKFRDLINDQSETPLERAVWWTEYIIRNKGAPHLRTKVRHLSWYQRDLLDVIAFVILIVFLICFMVYKSFFFSIKVASSSYKNSRVTKSKIN